MEDNLKIYELCREVPIEAKRSIEGGRLKGKTDINPMWRIRKLTEMFGPCGDGWSYTITDKQIIDGSNGEKACFVDIILSWIDSTGETHEVPGTGGSMFVTNETKGLYVNDECFKMALTDAISVACKAIGMGADVYWDKGRTKYTPKERPQKLPVLTMDMQREINNCLKGLNNGVSIEEVKKHYNITADMQEYLLSQVDL